MSHKLPKLALYQAELRPGGKKIRGVSAHHNGRMLAKPGQTRPNPAESSRNPPGIDPADIDRPFLAGYELPLPGRPTPLCVVWCRYCRRWHQHGDIPIGTTTHRAPHCHVPSSIYLARGYMIRVLAEAPAWVLADLRRRRPRGPQSRGSAAAASSR